MAHDGGNRVGGGMAPPATDDGAGIADDANGGRLERNVEADIMALLIHAFLRVTFDTAELTGCAWSAADALRFPHVPSPAIRFAERAEGLKGPKRSHSLAACRLATLVFRSALTPEHAE